MLTCNDCGAGVDPLEIFPGDRCIDCHANTPETRAMLRGMTADKLARMWGGR